MPQEVSREGVECFVVRHCIMYNTFFFQIFVYPDNVAYPFGGEGYIMIELHYDNPKEIEGIAIYF